ncbi:MBOAT family O-acyltransferase [Ruminococcus sp.]|uniref:MBOAT family O-acyltransferase n=1 Tax=Ruminococcus sp. TaxID=41978 RepID=UPI0025F14AF5|nr:MBOAT family O-acyltransferase [Ruminococcus sp.]MBQ8967077.1 acyltransferase [Ruminococcus sp.]
MTYTDLIFLFGMFPAATVLSLLDRSSEYKNLILILTSLLFFSWGRPFAVCLIFLSLFVDWGIGLAVGSLRAKSRPAALAMTVIDAAMNLGLMLVFGHNYLFEGRSPGLEEVMLPVGMGYYSLRGFSYVQDVFRGKIRPERNVFCLMTYMVSFHLMCAGPVVRYGDMESQIRSREVNTDKLNAGLNRMVWGLGKIVLLSEVFAKIMAAGLNGNEITTLGCWLGMLAFFARYYFLFTGLCDMSRGLSLVGGFVLPLNYRDIEPDELFTGMVKSYNTTVVGFFADLLGLPESKSKVRTAVGAVICGGLMGLWYHVSLGCLVIGLAAGALVAAEQLFLKDILAKLPAAVKYIYLVLTAMIIFGGLEFKSFYGYRKWLLGLVGVGTKYTLSVAVKNAVMNNYVLILIAFCVVCAPVRRLITGGADKLSAKNRRAYSAVRAVKTLATAAVLVISAITLAASASVV